MLRKNAWPVCVSAALLAITLLPKMVYGQLSETASWAATLSTQYRVSTDITYLPPSGL
jgi:hypothetical protein